MLVLFFYVICKKLSPIYYICFHRLNVLILIILYFINDRIYIGMKGLNRTIRILDILISVFYIIGAIIYLEFIELNFCNLNFYTRRNIKERANIEYNIGDISIDSEYSS